MTTKMDHPPREPIEWINPPDAQVVRVICEHNLDSGGNYGVDGATADQKWCTEQLWIFQRFEQAIDAVSDFKKEMGWPAEMPVIITSWSDDAPPRPHVWRYSPDETIHPWIVSIPGVDARDFDTWREAYDYALTLTTKENA